MDHRIDRIKFDVDFSDQEEARDLQDKFFSICRNGLNRALENVLEKYNLTLSIENMELDMGKISRRDLDHQLMDLLAERFEQALISHIEELQQSQSSEKYQLEALTLFLEKGLKHWSDVGNLSLLDLFRAVLKRSAASLIRFMISTRHQITVVSRLVTLIDERDYADLVAKMRPAEASFILSFIAEVKEVNAIKPVSPAATGDQLDDSLRQLVLIDLIKSYGSAFNRRMFIERNLRALAKAFNLSFEALLRHFELILNQEVPYSMSSTLPGLIQTISQMYRQDEAPADQEIVDHASIFASLIAINAPLHEQLQESFVATLKEYSGEVRDYLLRHTRTEDQIKSLVDKLEAPQLDQLIEVVEPDEYGYIQTYVSAAKGVAREQIGFRSDQALHAQVYQIVLSYLLIDRGTRFNQKAFLRYQLIGMSQVTGATYRMVLKVFRESLDMMGTSMIGTGMLAFLQEFLSEEETRFTDENFAESIEIEEIELVRQYLKSGTLPVHLRNQLRLPVTKTIQQMLSDDKSRSELFEFFKEEQEQVLAAMMDLKHSEFEVIVRIILLEYWQLTSTQADQFFDRLRKLERQVVYPVAYRKVVFQLLMEPSLKVRQTGLPAVSMIHSAEVSDVLVYQLQEQLSLPRIMQHPDFENTLDFQRSREITFAKARKRLLAAIEDPKTDPEPHVIEAIRSAFHKLQESEFETFTLLDHLRQEEVQYMLGSLEKQHFHKLVDQLTFGKWQVLKKALLLVVKGGASKRKEIAGFFTELVRRRKQNIQQVFLWFREQYETLDLPNYYADLVQKQLQELNTRLELSRDSPEEKQRLTREQEALFHLLARRESEPTNTETADVLFDQLFRSDSNVLFKQLHQLSFRPEAVANYVEQLSASSIEQWIRYETGAGYQEFNALTQNIERFLLLVFKVDRKIHLDQKRLRIIRLMLANRVGQYAVSFEQVLRFYMQELAEHSAYKYQLVQQWLSVGLKRTRQEVSSWMDTKYLASLEEEIDPPSPSTQPVGDQISDVAGEEASEELSNLKVPNAGLVLIWPFFQRLFSMLEYLNEEGVFKSNVERSRAVRLLHHICGLDWDDPEYNLTLNKILCGMPFSERMEPGLEITDQEKEIAEQMLGGVIQNWPHLGNTSISGLQESFLQRNGFLEKEEENWKLKVEKSGIDILIDHMPWSYASVILRWTPGAVYVEWR